MDLVHFYPLILDSMSEGVFTVDSGFRITYFNRAAEKIVGLKRQEALGRKCFDVFRSDICQTSCALKATLATREPQSDARVTILNSKMEEIPLCVSTALLRDDSGAMLGGVEVFQDMSDLEFLRERLNPTEPFHNMLGVSREMQRIFAVLPDVAKADASALIVGESGTGKELVARALHQLSERRDGPFMAVNCAAFPDTLLESELFGYEEGAFTGATRSKPGLFVQADQGTLFLDEIGDVSPSFQAKLLRVLQDQRVLPLGATRTRKMNVRVVAATNRDLRLLMEEGRIRQDFFYRISVIPIHISPLRERRVDIVLLLRHYLKVFALRYGKTISGFTPRALGILRDHDYPGNVRELINLVERAVVLSHSDSIGVEQLPPELVESRIRWPRGSQAQPPATTTVSDEIGSRTDGASPDVAPPSPPMTERTRILIALSDCKWNRSTAAARLGIGRTTLWRKMKKLGLA